MAVTVIDALKNTAEFNDASITTSSLAVDDIIVAYWGMNYYAASAVTTPTQPSGTTTWTAGPTADRGANQVHMKTWWSKVTSAGAKTITFNTDVNDANDHLFVYVFRGLDPTTPIRASATSTGASSTSWVAPASGTSPSAPVAGDALLCFWGDGGDTTGQTTLTFPGSMSGTNQSQRTSGDPTGPSGDNSGENFSVHGAAYEILASGGATTSRTVTVNSADQWAAITIVLAGLGGDYSGTATSSLAVSITETHVKGNEATATMAETVTTTAVGSVGKSASAQVDEAIAFTAAGVVNLSASATLGLTETISPSYSFESGVSASASLDITIATTPGDVVFGGSATGTSSLGFGITSAGVVDRSASATISLTSDITAVGLKVIEALAVQPISVAIAAAGGVAMTQTISMPLAVGITAAGYVSAGGQHRWLRINGAWVENPPA